MMKRIVLMGFMGAGKTTIGKELAAKLSWNFIDTDALIAQKYGDIPTIFEKYGEEAFRNMETEIVKEASKECGCIIATGGGAILRDENVDALKSNGKILTKRFNM